MEARPPAFAPRYGVASRTTDWGPEGMGLKREQGAGERGLDDLGYLGGGG